MPRPLLESKQTFFLSASLCFRSPGFRYLRICADLQDFCRSLQICADLKKNETQNHNKNSQRCQTNNKNGKNTREVSFMSK